MKELLCTAPVLVFFDEKAFEHALHVDASNISCGGVLVQRNSQEDRHVHPVAYASRKFSKSARNLSTIERETLGILFCSKKFRKYLLRRRVMVYTDHASLTWINSLKTENNKLQRWSIALGEFQFVYIHRSGTANRDADALSRNAVEEAPPENIDPVDADTFHLNSVEVQTNDLRIEQLKDKYCGPIIDVLENQVKERSERAERMAVLHVMDMGLLYYRIKVDGVPRQLLVLPRSMWVQVCRSVHEARSGLAHLGLKRCLDVMVKRFYFPKMNRFLKQFIATCHVCQTRNASFSSAMGKLQTIPVVPRVWYSVVCDTVGPIKRSSKGNRYVFTCIDEFSSFLVAKPVAKHPQLAFTKFLLEVALRYGFFRVLRTDMGGEMTGNIVKGLVKIMDVKHLTGSGWRPQTTGKIERQHRTLGAQLAKMCSEDQADWDEQLPYAVFAINASPSSTTGMSPYQCMYGVECLFALDNG